MLKKNKLCNFYVTMKSDLFFQLSKNNSTVAKCRFRTGRVKFTASTRIPLFSEKLFEGSHRQLGKPFTLNWVKLVFSILKSTILTRNLRP